MTDAPTQPTRRRSALADVVFIGALWKLGLIYLILIVAMLVALETFTTPAHILEALDSPAIRYAVTLSLISATLSTLLSLWVAVPLGYLLSRYSFRGRSLLDAIVDIPIVLPPLVVGLGLLVLFQTAPGRAIEDAFNAVTGRHITFDIPAVILAQFMVACAFAVRTMRVTFDQNSPRTEQVALTLGCSRSQAFWMVVVPESRRGMLTAATLAWARSLGEFGPVLIFAGATRMRTEVLPTTIFLELSIGEIEAAVAVSLLMISAAVTVLVVARVFGLKGSLL